MSVSFKLALAQLNYKVGDFDNNRLKIISEIKNAIRQDADLIIFSELAVCGYPPLDLLKNKEFINKAVDTIHDIAKHCKGIAAVVGCPSIVPESGAKQLYNSAWFLHNGKAEPLAHKTLLSRSGEFDEARYFSSNNNFETISFKGFKIALIIGHDIYDKYSDEVASGTDLSYNFSPLEKLSSMDPDFIVHIAAFPFSHHQHISRKQILSNHALLYKLPIYSVNQVGANTSLIFDGGSMVISSEGEILKNPIYFNEGTFISTFGSNIQEEISEPESIELIYTALITGIKDYFSKAGLSKAVLGLSGGIDSALTAVLASRALGSENVHGILMPSQYSSDHSITDAIDLANNLGISYELIHIEQIYNQYEAVLQNLFKGLPSDTTEENLQVRIRGAILMAYSNKFGNVLLNTSNKSESAVGYGTLYGDMNGGLSVLGDLYKTQVIEMSHYINRKEIIIPVNSIMKPPSAELKPDQKDTDSLPDYPILDEILFLYIEKNYSYREIIAKGHSPETVLKVFKLVNKSEYKRFQAPPVLSVSGKPFGFGRRMPLVANYHT